MVSHAEGLGGLGRWRHLAAQAGHRRARSLAALAMAAALLLQAPMRSFRPAFAQASTGTRLQDIETLRKAAALPSQGSARPDEDAVLKAVLRLQRQKLEINKEAPFLMKLTGDGKPGGRRWRLTYLATRDAVVASRKNQPPPSWLDRGWYVDGFVTAVQRFEDSDVRINQNGVYELFGIGGFFFGYFARYQWPSPEKRSTLGFQPFTKSSTIFGFDMESPADAGFAPGVAGNEEFEQSRLKDLNIFNFLYADDEVAVAQGETGSIALWARTDDAWDAAHLVPVKAPIDLPKGSANAA